ncbi:hypothetical protein M0P65_06135 [Candidatus Gracilibacteria bacterium]|jgi:hypothetical protein|nr:hypothetical protein [Candidatus Gracilibacteria bacterium]
MIDLKIKQLFSEIKTENQAKLFLDSYVEIFEKIDGTKLTLYRNNVEYDINDYTKNWIVSYKSNIIYKEDFFGLDEEEINEVKNESIGISQYYFVHKFLEEKIHPNSKELPINTELFIEFAQRKPTLTRDYEKYHLLFLIGYSTDVKIHIDNGKYYSMGLSVFIPFNVIQMAEMLKINFPPLIFNGKLAIKVINHLYQYHQNLHNLEQIFDDFLHSENSILGGVIEGIVIHQDNKIYKVVQSDQYNKKKRLRKKQRYQAENDELEKKYWEKIKEVSTVIIKIIINHPAYKNKITTEFLSLISKKCYNSNSLNIIITELKKYNKNKTNINFRDDLYLTTKLSFLQQKYLTKNPAFYVIAGKPVHLGHWRVIEKISKEHKDVMLFISTSNRDNISGKDMFDIWVDYLIPILPQNVHCIFSDSPMHELIHIIDFSNSQRKYLYLSEFTIYADDFDIIQLKSNEKLAFSFVHFKGINRLSTVDISGTLMRQFLESDIKQSFIKYLPPVNDEIKEKIWYKLKK